MRTPIVLLLLVFCCMAFPSHGQWTFGIKGSYIQSGQNMESVLTYVGYTDYSKKVNGHGASVILYYRIFKFLHIGIEPGIVSRGNRAVDYWTTNNNPFACWNDETGDMGDCLVEQFSETSVFARYLHVPLLLKGNLPIIKDRFSIFLKGGGSISWLATAQREMHVGRITELSDIHLKEDTYLKRKDMAWQAGAGMQFKIGTGSLFLETVIYQGTKDFYIYTKSTTRSLETSLGYQINLN